MSAAFRSFAADLGYELPPVEPGRRIRFSTNGKVRDDAGWALLFADAEGGVIGDWRTGERHVWQANRGKVSAPEFQALREKAEKARQEAEAERQREAEAAAARADEIWKACKPATGDHPYLKAKKVSPFGLRVYAGQELVIRGMNCAGALVMPLRNSDGVIRSLEFIGEEKRFLPNGDYRGCYYAIGKASDRIAVCEGFATGATIYKEAAIPVRIAATAGNLEEVAKAIRAKAPQAQITICADNDRHTVCREHKKDDITEAASPMGARPEWCRCNPGVTYALQAARAAGASIAIPETETGTDFNDVAAEGGDVKSQVAGAKAVPLNGSHVSVLSVPSAGDPKPLPEGLPKVEAFAVELLPESLQAWASDICERVQCAPDYVAVPIIAGLGALIGRKVGIRPQDKTDWTEVANQWGMLVGRPGVLKSPAMEQALKPLKLLAAKAAEKHALEKEEYEQAARILKLRAEASEKAARSKLAKNAQADITNELVDAEGDEPRLKRYIANDTSYQALGELLRYSQNGVMVYRDEIVSLLKALDREDNAEARGFYLTGWNGDSSYTFDRIGRGENLHVPAVCISLLGSTQPGRISEYLRTAVKGGAGDDGLIQRFGLLVWPDNANWKDVDATPDAQARAQANAVFKRLDELDPFKAGAVRDSEEEIPYLRFSPDALALFRDWRAQLEAKLRAGDLHPALESHLAKYRKLVPGLALICHLADNGNGPVTAQATLRALAWAQYLESHAKRAYASVGSPEVTAAKAIIAKLKAKELPATFAARDIYRAGWANLAERDQVIPALNLLEDFDWIFSEIRATEGRSATIYTVNPRVI